MISTSALTAHLPRHRVSLAIPDTRGWGMALAFATALISGVAVFLNASAVKTVADPAVFTTLKNGVAAVVLLGAMLATVRPERVAAIDRRTGLWVVVVGAIGGSVPFVLFFTGLAAATAPSAAFIHKTMFLWVALLAVPFLGERLGWAQVAALALLLVGQGLILPPTGMGWGGGETLIAAATLLWAVEVVLAKHLLVSVPPLVMGTARMGFGLVILVGYLIASGRTGAIGAIGPAGWGWILVTGLLLAGYVATWFGALQRAPATLVTAILVVGAGVTGGLGVLANGTVPAMGPALGYVLIGLAVAGAVAASSRRRRVPIAVS